MLIYLTVSFPINILLLKQHEHYGDHKIPWHKRPTERVLSLLKLVVLA